MRLLSKDLLHETLAYRQLAAAALTYTMSFPESARERDEGLATVSSEVMGKHMASPEDLVRRAAATEPMLQNYLSGFREGDHRLSDFVNDVAGTALRELSGRVFVPAGGFSTVARAQGTANLERRFSEVQPQAMFAGLALMVLYQMHAHHGGITRGGASINKLWALFLQWKAADYVPTSKTSMRKHWKNYRNVSHLWATCHHIEATTNKHPVEVLLRDPVPFLHIAKSFENFALSFFRDRPVDTSDPWNPEAEIWRVPDCEAAAGAEMPQQLPYQAQLALAAYKALIDG